MKAFSDRLPEPVYAAAQVRELERLAIASGVSGDELMKRAGAAAFELLRQRWPRAHSVAIVAGVGNNAGDGFVVARLAKAAGLAVDVLSVAPEAKLAGEAARSAAECRAAGVAIDAFDRRKVGRADVVVDALLGTGLSRPVDGDMRAAIESINAACAPVLSLDIPSGLDADSGWPNPTAVRANTTLTFLGLKQGLFLGDAADHCGRVEFDGLAVPAEMAARLGPPLARLTFADLARALPRRARNAHKGSCGRLLLVGGGPGMPGAIRLAAEAALRVGAGLVYVATHVDNVVPVLAGRPEIICKAVGSAQDLEELIGMADGAVLGPGLGQSAWARGLWRRVVDSELPLVVDADGLNWLAAEPIDRGRWLLTPHAGEAARLLGSSVGDVQRDRKGAAQALARRFGATIVLKGPNTLVATPHAADPTRVCDRGNPGMATAGTGDVLAGTLGALYVQTRDFDVAARAGVLMHALAGDAAAEAGERGTVAGDLLPHLRAWANPL
jgi:NAD(P)H-hydrate epimerase